jgi:hypothetical protein
MQLSAFNAFCPFELGDKVRDISGTEHTIDLFSNRRDDIMTAWEGEKKRRMPKRFFLNGCTG